MTFKKLTRSTSTLVSIAAFVAILAAVNFFLFRHPVRADLTENKVFSISDATRNMLKNMTDDVNITIYRSDELPPMILPDYRFTKEFLEEMASLSGGKLNVVVEVPKDDPETEQTLARKGVQKQQVNVMQKDELKVQALYYHLLVQHLDKTRVITFPQPAMLEYAIASALLEVTQREKPIVTFVTNDSEFQFQDILYFLRERMGMSERYDIRSIALDKEQELRIPKDCKTLILVKPKDFKETDLYKVDQFVMNGGTLVVLAEAVDFGNPMAMFQPSPPPNILPLLQTYGIRVNSDLVLDYKSHATRTVPAGRQGIFTVMTEVPYPQWVVARSGNFDKDNPALAYQQALLLPFANSLEFSSELPDGVETIKLITSSDKATAQEHPPFDLQPPKDESIPENTKQYTLAAAVTGPLTSYYKDKEKPEEASDQNSEKEQDPLRAMENAEEENAPKLDQAKDARVVVLSTAEFLNPDILRSTGGAIVQQSLFFVENMIDWLSLGTDLIAIRTKPIKQYPLRAKLSDGEKLKAKFLGRFAVPLVVVIVGVIWWFIRRRRLNKLAQVYAQ